MDLLLLKLGNALNACLQRRTFSNCALTDSALVACGLCVSIVYAILSIILRENPFTWTTDSIAEILLLTVHPTR
jgi:hypothetical protein